MQWAKQRQLRYALVVVAVAGLIGTGIGFAFFHHPATCTDGIQNQDELGIDCGGSCQRLCTAPRVSALWARAVPVAPGVYHAVALVRNPEGNAGTERLPYKFSLFDKDNILIAERSGEMYLAPAEIAPLFEPNILTGTRVPVHVYVEFGEAVWGKYPPQQNPVRVISHTLDSESLKLTAHIQNLSVYSVESATVTALLYDAEGNLVNASQTTVSNLLGKGEKDISFTWQQPFERPVVRVEITPRLQ